MDKLTIELLVENHLKWLRDQPSMLQSTLEGVGWKAIFTLTTDKDWVVALLN